MSAVLPQQLVALPGTYETDYSQTSTTTSFAVFKCKKSRITTLSSDLLARSNFSSDLLARPNFKHVNKTFPLHISSRNDCISSIELSEYSQKNAVDRSAPTCLPLKCTWFPTQTLQSYNPYSHSCSLIYFANILLSLLQCLVSTTVCRFE